MRGLWFFFSATLMFGLTGCSTTGQSTAREVVAPKVVKAPSFVSPELQPYAGRVYAVLDQYGFSVGPTDDPDALRLQLNFDPNSFRTSVTVLLSKPGMGVVAKAEAVNRGWGTVVARDQAIGNLVESAASNFNEQLSSIRFQFQADRYDFKSCFSQLANNDDFSTLRDKVALSSVGEESFANFLNDEKPTEEDAKVLQKWGEARNECMSLRKKALISQQVPSVVVGLVDTVDSASQSMLVKLIKGELTYSEYAFQRRDLADFANDEIAKIDQELRKENDEARFRAQQIALEAQKNRLLQQQNANERYMHEQRMSMENRRLQENRRMDERVRTTSCYATLGGVKCFSW